MLVILSHDKCTLSLGKFLGPSFWTNPKKKKIDSSLYILIDVRKRVNIKYYKGNGDKWDHWYVKLYVCSSSSVKWENWNKYQRYLLALKFLDSIILQWEVGQVVFQWEIFVEWSLQGIRSGGYKWVVIKKRQWRQTTCFKSLQCIEGKKSDDYRINYCIK